MKSSTSVQDIEGVCESMNVRKTVSTNKGRATGGECCKAESGLLPCFHRLTGHFSGGLERCTFTGSDPFARICL